MKTSEKKVCVMCVARHYRSPIIPLLLGTLPINVATILVGAVATFAGGGCMAMPIAWRLLLLFSRRRHHRARHFRNGQRLGENIRQTRLQLHGG